MFNTLPSSILNPMSELAFSQPESPNFLVPILIALVIVGGAFGYVYLKPHRIADIAVTHSSILPTHTVFKTGSKLVGAQDESQDILYVLATVRIDNHLKIPLTIEDLSGTVTPLDNNTDPTTVPAIQKMDLDNAYMAFPALKPLSGPPLLRESSIEPGGHAEGMVLLNFPLTEADWNQRKSATVSISFYRQEPFTITIPKS
jgi:hypothetical protein